MKRDELKTMKEVAEKIHKPSHRIIHICESDVVRPAIDADGRGSVRRFSREDVFRIDLALQLQAAGASLSLLKKLMEKLDRFKEIREFQAFGRHIDPFDLVSIIRHVGTNDPGENTAVLAWLTPPDRVALVTPMFLISARPDIRVEIRRSIDDLAFRGVGIVANLSMIAAGL